MEHEWRNDTPPVLARLVLPPATHQEECINISTFDWNQLSADSCSLHSLFIFLLSPPSSIWNSLKFGRRELMVLFPLFTFTGWVTVSAIIYISIQKKVNVLSIHSTVRFVKHDWWRNINESVIISNPHNLYHCTLNGNKHYVDKSIGTRNCVFRVWGLGL